jgi:hypothetical protein
MSTCTTSNWSTNYHTLQLEWLHNQKLWPVTHTFWIYANMCDLWVWTTVTKCWQPEYQLGHTLKLQWNQIQQWNLITVISKQYSATPIKSAGTANVNVMSPSAMQINIVECPDMCHPFIILWGPNFAVAYSRIKYRVVFHTSLTVHPCNCKLLQLAMVLTPRNIFS